MQSKLILIRGLPGSGKSTWAKSFVAHGFVHFEADQFFETGEGYRYDASKIKMAHAWCQRQTKNALDNGLDVVVSNTFSRQWEMQAYRDLTSGYLAPLTILTARGSWPNIHGVPDDVIAKMRERWEDA